MTENFKENNEYYYRESVAETPQILAEITNSHNQNLYRDYLAEYRNIPKTALEDSYMFYVLDGFEELDEIIPSEYVRDLMGIQTGDFVRQKERFVLPILDSLKTIIGFVGYDYDASKYKYLMTFAKFTDKENIFFNMQNLPYAYKQDVCIIEEGVFDSIRLNSLGYKNNLCLLGKRMTDFHIRLLSRFSLVILIPDNDEPGMASHKIWTKLLSNTPAKVATIYLSKSEIDKIKMDPETSEKTTVRTKVKDLDDYLSVEANQIKFRNTYRKILKEYDNPLVNNKRYSL